MPLCPCWRRSSKSKYESGGTPGAYSNTQFNNDENTLESQKSKETIESLQERLKEKDKQLEEQGTTIKNLKTLLKDRGDDILQLTNKLEELQKLATRPSTNSVQSNLDSKRDSSNEIEQETDKKSRRRGIRGVADAKANNTKKYPKTEAQMRFLKQAILNNEFLYKMVKSEQQLQELIDFMRYTTIKDHIIIREGTKGNQLYILESGKLHVSKRNKHIATIESGSVFGELAILYETNRSATVKATGSTTKLWMLEGNVFRHVMTDAAISERTAMMQSLRKVEDFKRMDPKHLGKIGDAVETCSFETGEYIIKQGEDGDTFFIIMEGEVDITIFQNVEAPEGESPGTTEAYVRTLKKWDCFGEKALLGDGKRSTNVVAKTKVKCFTLDKATFTKLVGMHADKSWTTPAEVSETTRRKISSIYERLSLDDFETIGTLGVGGFGRVDLVRPKENKSSTFALKCLKKTHIIETGQEERIYIEKNIMLESDSPFLVQLFKTFRDKRYVYMLMEVCLGGELWSKLRDDGKFDELRAKFYTACVVEALEYLHRGGIVYRDLKPENLMLDKQGYVKLIDFGFAKKLSSAEKTWTFCGTPEYVAPEVILSKGHDMAVDFWALGVLIYEMLSGTPPFSSPDVVKTYRRILRGIEAIKWPFTFQAAPKNLVRRLCRENPADRIGNLKDGMSQIKDHRWFHGFNWPALTKRQLVAPVIPKIDNPTDMRNFDNFEGENDFAEIEMSGWDKDF